MIVTSVVNKAVAMQGPVTICELEVLGSRGPTTGCVACPAGRYTSTEGNTLCIGCAIGRLPKTRQQLEQAGKGVRVGMGQTQAHAR